MKEEYIIDENVIYNAWHGRKSDNTPALAEKKFLYDIFYGKQHIYISEKIRKKIIRMRKAIPKDPIDLDSFALNMFLKLIFNSERTTILTGIKTDFQGIKKCDNEFVGVALQSNGILVTADAKLKKAIEADPKVAKCNCITADEVVEKN
ncbi:MAG: hypothetical protein ACREAL_08685 [Nitrosopumilaceae archaeon]